jgi:hypothetical protein
LLGLSELPFDEAIEIPAGIDVRQRLRASAVELSDDPQVLGMLINAHQDAVVVLRFCRLRDRGGCDEVGCGMSVGLHNRLSIVEGFGLGTTEVTTPVRPKSRRKSKKRFYDGRVEMGSRKG